MDIKTKVREKLSKLLFLELKKGKKLGDYYINEEIYVPIKAISIIADINKGGKMDKVPISAFIEGMVYLLGADNEFKYRDQYIEILNSIKNSEKLIKNMIFRELKEKRYEEAYILIKGLLNIEKSEDVYNKTFILLQQLISLDKDYVEEEIKIINESKKIPNYAMPYFYETIVYKNNNEFERALMSIHKYLELGGKETEEISELKESLLNINQFNKGKKLAVESPEEALKRLIPLIDYYGDSPNIYYYIAVAYRNLGNFEKAIYYLNEASSIDNALIEVLNEYGINYASLGEFKKAAVFFEKAFEAIKNVEICTNIIMCYLNDKDLEKAEKFMQEAMKLDKDDEVVKELLGYFPNIDD